MYINDITEDIDSDRRLCADDCVCYREIQDIEETSGEYRPFRVLGKELGYEIPTSQMQYNADYKETDKKINASYSWKATVLDNVEKIKYLGITIINDLKWNTRQQYLYKA